MSLRWSQRVLAKCGDVLDSLEYATAVAEHDANLKTSRKLLSLIPSISIIAFAVAAGVAALIGLAVVRRRLPSRKYIVVISRLAADSLTAALLAIATLVSPDEAASRVLLALCLLCSTFGFAHLALSHALVIALRQISLSRPVGFSTLASPRRVAIACLLLWLLAALYTAGYAPLFAVLLKPVDNAGTCSYSGCQRPLLAVCIAVLAFFLVAVGVVYMAVCYNLRCQAIKEKVHNEPDSAGRSLRRFLWFGSHIALFLLIGSLLLAGCVLILHNAWLFDRLRSNGVRCEVIEYIETLYRLETLACGAILLWLVRMLFDACAVLMSEHRRALPWPGANHPQRLNNQVVTRSDSLRWQRGNINCPVFNLEKSHPWNYKN